ncbi:MAG: T9SS type A sorting domain-containing protein [Bacteroidota bacterium]|nr:T9SS type A sorting domain-containing protein [Bacteroidota bacterium]
MNMKMKVIHFLWLGICMTQSLIAQQGVVSSGGDILSTNGSVAYSVGQIAFTSISGEDGNVSTGIQQPFQFKLVGINDLDRAHFITLYPNPANQLIYLRLSTDIDIILSQDFIAKVYDVKGNLLFIQKLSHDVNSITISSLPEALYFVQVWQSKTFIQSLSFTKSN